VLVRVFIVRRERPWRARILPEHQDSRRMAGKLLFWASIIVLDDDYVPGVFMSLYLSNLLLEYGIFKKN
jgi:hypothetical protein